MLSFPLTVQINTFPSHARVMTDDTRCSGHRISPKRFSERHRERHAKLNRYSAVAYHLRTHGRDQIVTASVSARPIFSVPWGSYSYRARFWMSEIQPAQLLSPDTGARPACSSAQLLQKCGDIFFRQDISNFPILNKVHIVLKFSVTPCTGHWLCSFLVMQNNLQKWESSALWILLCGDGVTDTFFMY